VSLAHEDPDAATPPRRRAVSDEDKASRRTAILAAAKEVFAERGYHATTIADIARCAGLSYGSIYWYYESKEVLFHELMSSEAAALRIAVDTAVRSASLNEGPEAPFKAAVRATLEFYEADKALVRLLFRDAFALGTAFERHLHAIHASFVDDTELLVKAAQAEGVFAERPPRTAAFAITALVGQLAHRRLTTDDGQTADMAAEALVDLLLNGLVARPAAAGSAGDPA
jgi:AcrR family transcriptional regulator